MARGEHDRPDPSLIVQGSRRPHPSKRIQGDDYPITPLEELCVRSKGMYSLCATTCTFRNLSLGNPSSLGTNISEDTLNSSSSKHETYHIDISKPDGDACREDGTLKDASEMEWLNSPTDNCFQTPPGLQEYSDHSHLEWPSESGTKKKRKHLESEPEESPNAKVSFII